MPCTRSLAQAIQQEALYTYLTYSIEQIYMAASFQIYLTQQTHYMTIWTKHFGYNIQNITSCNFHFTCHCQICSRNKYYYQSWHICQKCPILDVYIWEMYVLKCATCYAHALKYCLYKVVQTYTDNRW